jgi:hypothetical protein
VNESGDDPNESSGDTKQSHGPNAVVGPLVRLSFPLFFSRLDLALQFSDSVDPEGCAFGFFPYRDSVDSVFTLCAK